MTTAHIPSETIRRAQAADPQALASIYERYAPGIYRYIYYRVGDEELARDLNADVFVRMLEGIDRYEDRGWSIASWLYRIAHDRTIDSLRRRDRLSAQPIDLLGAAYDGPDESIDNVGERAAVRRAMARLSPSQRQVLLLRVVYDLPIQEAARQMRRTAGSIKSLQHRALENLTRLVKEELGED